MTGGGFKNPPGWIAEAHNPGSGARPAIAEGNETRGGDQGFLARDLDQPVVRRERAGGIGDPCVAGQVVGLATAAAEVDRAPVAATAWIGHPALAPERVHPLRVVPQIAERTFADVGESDARE